VRFRQRRIMMAETRYDAIMVRMQVQLTEQQVAKVKRLAGDRGVSVAALVREAVDELPETTEREARWERALAVVGKYRSGLRDVSERHDDYLTEDYLG
jgi:Arc/MetJ-type ribon-helix-helix transcriptional regulator